MNSRTAAKRNDILDTAALLFAERGFQGTNMKLLAQRAQASTSTIYAYFQDKNDLLSQSIEHRLETLEADHLKRVGELDEPVEALLQGVSLLNSSVADDPLLASLVVYDRWVADVRLTRHARRVLHRIDEHNIALIERAIADGVIECEDARALVTTLRHAFQGWLLGRQLGEKTLSEAQFTRTIKHLILGLINDD